ncbi:hypothetical protein A9K97_gp053 [Tokyovirus A1]|uniref:hypothetical protein n=1 Tax=Tokyovirus A1 TaxID=1826170 RepID=UPI0007A96F37|nr:hypothetical protein A9K97_gp053 [Tokyovirus A1]BAU80298.1 hypothetical protein [Tokyovirus A1]
MQSFFKNGEYISFCLSEGVPPLKEQRDRFLKRGKHMDVSKIENDLLSLVVGDIDHFERENLLEDACETEDIERFGILTFWKGDTKYIAENDMERFNLPIDFYCDMLERGIFDTFVFMKSVEKSARMSAAHILCAMLGMMDERKKKELEELRSKLERFSRDEI